MRQPEDQHFCPLFNRNIYWGGPGGCYEVQEVREDSMDMELMPQSFDIKQADKHCEDCQWYNVSKQKQK